MSTQNRKRPIRFRRPVAENTAVLDRSLTHQGQRTGIVETPRILTEAPGMKPGRLLVQLIKAGWSLNGRYYPAEVLRRDGPRAFPAGTLNFVDHATDVEDEERPAGSLLNLASYQSEDARWDESRQALIAEVRLYAPWRETVTDWAESGAVGMSIRAWVYGEQGTAEGRDGWIVSEFDSGRSVDYVTIPAAGGAMLEILESVQAGRPAGPASLAEARSVGVWLESRLHLELTRLGDDMYGNGRLTRPERITLSSAIGDALQAWTAKVEADAPQLFERDIWDEPTTSAATAEAKAVGEATSAEIRRALEAAVRATHGTGDHVYVWLLDYDAEARQAYWERSTQDDCQTWSQPYSIGDGGVATLTGDALQVVARVVYDPVATPAAVQQQAESVVVVEAAPFINPTNVTGGAPPTAPTHPSETKESSVSGNQTTGPAPGAGGAGTTPATETTARPAETSEAARIALLEAELGQLRTRASGLSEQLAEAQADGRKANARAAEAEAKAKRFEGNEAGRTTVDRLLAAPESGVPDTLQALIGPRVHAAITNHVPFTDTGDVDQTALEAAVAAAIRTERVHAASLLEAQGVGRVSGLGADGDPTMQVSDEALERGLADVFTATGMDEATAKLAAKGR